MNRVTSLAAAAFLTCSVSQPANAWGNDGHRTIGLIAQHYLTSAELKEIQRLLSLPVDPALPATLRDRATWADLYRDSDRNTSRKRYNATRNWHFVDLDIDHPDMKAACFGNPPLPAGTLASTGPANDCVVDKIGQFTTELADKSLPDAERAKALMFLLHFVGDVHQPMHTAEHAHDSGGNIVYVVPGQGKTGTNLHSIWDSNVVSRLGSKPETVAPLLIGGITSKNRSAWRRGAPRDWAMASFKVARDVAYALPAGSRQCTISSRTSAGKAQPCHQLTPAYLTAATGKARLQLQMAGVRLAWIIHKSIG